MSRRDTLVDGHSEGPRFTVDNRAQSHGCEVKLITRCSSVLGIQRSSGSGDMQLSMSFTRRGRRNESTQTMVVGWLPQPPPIYLIFTINEFPIYSQNFPGKESTWPQSSSKSNTLALCATPAQPRRCYFETRHFTPPPPISISVFG